MKGYLWITGGKYEAAIEVRENNEKFLRVLMVPEQSKASTESWLDVLVSSTKELEPPARFFWWSGLAAISAIVRKNVWLDRFSYILYPNIYVILVSAKSGLRKGIPISYANSIVEKVGVSRIISGRNSVQGVIKTLSEQFTVESPEGKRTVISDAQAFLCAAEFDSFLVKDDQGMSILTDLYNTYEHSGGWKNTLKSSPVEALKNPCITLLAASNEALFDNVIHEKDIEGGFIARSFIIHERRRRSVNSLMFAPEGLTSRSDLAEKIYYLRDVKGAFKIEPIVRHYYDKWYTELEESTDRTGTMERLGDHVLKVAMLIALSKGPDLIITKDTMTESIEKCQGFLAGTRKISMTQGKSEIAHFVGLVLKMLLEAEGNEMERTKALQKLHGNVDSMMFDRVMDDLGDLRGQGVVEIGRKKDGKIWYRMKKEFVDDYRKFGGKS